MTGFNAKEFADKQISAISKTIRSKRAIIAVSGGVDSTTSAALTHKAIGGNLVCVFINTNFMRLKEPKNVVKTLSSPPLNLPMKLIDARKRFMNALKGLEDAEKKRKAFRETFYRVLSEVAKKEKCGFLVQGTIAPDVIETKGGVKTQHNVLAQIGINPVERYGFKVVEPVLTLYKPQVREVARYLGVPPEMSERQPFCGPGLSVRCVGLITSDKLESLKKATAVVERMLTDKGAQQWFAAIIDSKIMPDPNIPKMERLIAKLLNVPAGNVQVKVLKSKATGVKKGMRLYGKIALVTVKTKAGKIYEASFNDLMRLQKELIKENPSFTRILYSLTEKPVKKPYVVAVRAIKTTNFVMAEVAEVDWPTLKKTAGLIMKEKPNVASVYYDVTPKPPSTIEFE